MTYERKFRLFVFVFICLMAGSVFAAVGYSSFTEMVADDDFNPLPVERLTDGPKIHWKAYYDVPKVDPTGRYVLCMESDFENRSPKPDDVIRIGIIDLQDNNKWTTIGTSRAWCWQQGCRLQWRGQKSGTEVVWNDREDDHFVTRVYNTQTKQTRTLDRPTYDISSDGKWSLSLNFSRIDDMRQGYGYEGLIDPYRDQFAPSKDGIYRMDIDTGNSEMLFSLEDIGKIRSNYEEKVKESFSVYEAKNKLYFNHIEWAPGDKRFFFLSRGDKVPTYNFSASWDGSDIRYFGKDASHYNWRDEESMIIFIGGMYGNYKLFKDDGTGESEVVWPAQNGHQTYFPGGEWIITDTYPQSEDRRFQWLYLYHVPTGRCVPIGKFNSPKAYASAEWRCDLHPYLTPDGKKVIFDSTHEGLGRQLYMVDISELIKSAPALKKMSDVGMAFPFKKDAVAWVEAESVIPVVGLKIDTRKADTTSQGKSLSVNSDIHDNIVCQWEFSVANALSQKDGRLALRYAAMEEVELLVEIDGKIAGKVRLPKTNGWGYSVEEWKSAVLKLNMPLKEGKHLLKITTVSDKPWNFDCFAFYRVGKTALDNAVNVELTGYLPGRSVQLSNWQSQNDEKLYDIDFGGKKTGYKIWTGKDTQRFYADEFLPAFFRRTLILDKPLDPGSVLSWKLTGPRGAFDINISSDAVTFHPRFYETPAFNEINSKASRHPEWADKKQEWVFGKGLKAVTVEIDQGMNLTLSLNGKPVLERKWRFDISRHQIQLDGDNKVAFQLTGPKTVQTKVSVDPRKSHQKMMGFGGIATPTAYAQLSPEGKAQWWKWLVEYNLLVQREYPNGNRLNPEMDNWDKLEDATPHYYSSNFPNGEISDFNYNRLIYQLGGIVWFEFWKLPPWVGKDVEKYAEAMVNYCRTSLKKAGKAPQVVGIQNEHLSSSERLHAMTLALRRKLDENGFEDIRIHMGNLPFVHQGIAEANKMKQSKEAWSKIDYSATNIYDYQKHFYELDGFDPVLREWKDATADKPFLAVEICIQNAELQLPGYRPALTMGQLYQKTLTIADASALAYCWSLLNIIEPSFGWSRTLFVVDRQNGFVPKPGSNQLRVFGAYSRRVKGGMVRVEARSDHKDVLVSAFKGDDNKATVIVLNRSVHPVEFALDWADADFTESERVNPYYANKVEPFDGGPVLLQGGEIVTLTNVELNVLPNGFGENME